MYLVIFVDVHTGLANLIAALNDELQATSAFLEHIEKLVGVAAKEPLEAVHISTRECRLYKRLI